MNRRDFLKLGATAGGVVAVGGVGACARTGGPDPLGATESLAPKPGALYRPPIVSPSGLVLAPRATTAEVAPGVTSRILSWDGGPIGPIIEGRTGARAEVVLRNDLAEPTIVHWHGLMPPQEADGHPRLAVGPGQTYRYDFQIAERASLYWYHPHPHMRTGAQVYFGLAGLFIVRDDAEEALDLPRGDREIAIVVQDKVRDAAGNFSYNVVGHQMMEGVLGNEAFVNGGSTPHVDVDSGPYRLRILAAGSARIFRVALSNGAPLRLIGTDGGLLGAPVDLPYIDLATGERADLLVDFSAAREGTTIALTSLPFPNPSTMGGGMGPMGGMQGRGGMPGMGGMMGGGLPQGSEMRLLDFRVTREISSAPLPSPALPPLTRLAPAQAQRRRTFRFDSQMMMHTINGRAFEMERVDERIPFGDTEIWTFVNNAPFPHPVHMHAVHFQVLARRNGRGAVMPWETGWKDTVLVHPGEEVDIIARFDHHRGMYLLHCHNLEHEDAGMMMNFAIE